MFILVKLNDKEMDFIAGKSDEIKYFQIAKTVRDNGTLKKEFVFLELMKYHLKEWYKLYEKFKFYMRCYEKNFYL